MKVTASIPSKLTRNVWIISGRYRDRVGPELNAHDCVFLKNIKLKLFKPLAISVKDERGILSRKIC